MDITTAVKAFLNRFQWTPSKLGNECPTIDRPSYRNMSTQTVDESSTLSQDVLAYDSKRLDETTQACLPKAIDPDNFEGYYEGSSNHDQDFRDGFSITLAGETEDDYTAGQSRFVVASDGTKQCAALLMTLHLSSLVQNAINAEREDSDFSEQAAADQQELSHLALAIECEISCREYLLEQENIDGSAGEEESESDAAMSREVQNLRLLLEDVDCRYHCIGEKLLQERIKLQRCRNDLTRGLEQAFVHAELVEDRFYDPDFCADPLDLQQEYSTFCQRLREAEEGCHVDVAASGVASNGDIPCLELLDPVEY
ncbi:unnamed protein product [Zymoseptoria tritici ST99CH_3D1]|nr:unnamed protein product [Zymoseptoria tritici ST99CH_3D1]